MLRSRFYIVGLIVRLRSSPAAGRNDISPAIPGLGHGKFPLMS